MIGKASLMSGFWHKPYAILVQCSSATLYTLMLFQLLFPLSSNTMHLCHIDLYSKPEFTQGSYELQNL